MIILAISRRPNIILVHVESMDGRKMGCMGYEPLRTATPHMDSLAQSGTLFTNAYTVCPICVPSRAGMLSGRYPHVHHCWNNHEGLKPDVPIFLNRFTDAAYRVKVIGDLGYYHGRHSIRDRVASWTRAAAIPRPVVRSPFPQVVDDAQDPWSKDWNKFNQAIDWLHDAKEQDSPFFLYLTTDLVHPAYRVQRKYMSRIDESKIDIPPADLTDHPVAIYQRTAKNALNEMPEHIVRLVRHIYLAMIANLDDMLGQLLQAVNRLGLAESTYFVFISDHGDMTAEHNQVLKRTMYEPAVRVPFIMSGPGIKPGQVIRTPVSLIDVYPTLLAMAGIPEAEELDGESLMPTACEGRSPQRDWAFAEYHGDSCNTGAFMIRQGVWKYIKFVGFQSQLFNLEDDPWEIKNLVATKPDVVEHMERLLADIVDCAAVDAAAKAYDKASFIRWRGEQKEAGTYEAMMSTVYSGFDALRLDDMLAWREQDEQLIRKWLGE
jgi:arylsulfatase A-like enzyme